MLIENHEVVPMGFETIMVGVTGLEPATIMKSSLWDLKQELIHSEENPPEHHEVVPMGFETVFVNPRTGRPYNHEVVPMGFETA